jgi:hypothetical protein
MHGKALECYSHVKSSAIPVRRWSLSPLRSMLGGSTHQLRCKGFIAHKIFAKIAAQTC